MRARATLFALTVPCLIALGPVASAQIGSERALNGHFENGDEYTAKLKDLLQHGEDIFTANWTSEDGGGRPMTKGTGAPLSDIGDPLVFPRDMNRISGPDANSCAGCHNLPRVGGGGDFVANVFVLGQRFDFVTLSPTPDGFSTKGTTDEGASSPGLQEVANSRNTLGMFGAGYIEMLSRQITTRLQQIRDSIPLNDQAELVAYGINFGTLVRNANDSWDTTGVDGLCAGSVASSIGAPPSLLVLPFHQAGAVVSLRQFTNNAMNHHHGIQSQERFGAGQDPDGDGVQDELTVADVTAVSLWQATLPPPGRVIPNNDAVEEAVLIGEQRFVDIGCADCHVPALPLVDQGWRFSEPNPFNPAGNLRMADLGPEGPVVVNLNSNKLPRPRLDVDQGVTWVWAFTDYKLHDITSGPADPNHEALDQHEAAGSSGFFAGNAKFMTRKLWGCANEPPYFHHGQYTTLRAAIEAHAGEAAAQKTAWDNLTDDERDAIIEFLKTLQVLPEGTKHLIVDPKGKKKKGWPEFPYGLGPHLTP